MAMTGEQIATLILNDDCTPSLSLLIRRAGAGDPVREFSLAEVRAGVARLKAAIAVAEVQLERRPVSFARSAK